MKYIFTRRVEKILICEESLKKIFDFGQTNPGISFKLVASRKKKLQNLLLKCPENDAHNK